MGRTDRTEEGLKFLSDIAVFQGLLVGALHSLPGVVCVQSEEPEDKEDAQKEEDSARVDAILPKAVEVVIGAGNMYSNLLVTTTLLNTCWLVNSQAAKMQYKVGASNITFIVAWFV